jgi:hypothetical protein
MQPRHFGMRGFAGVIALLVLGSAGMGDEQRVGSPNKASQPDVPDQRFLESEKAALAFAEDHHPELAGLLRQLRENAAEEYRKAIAEIDRNRERLEKFQEKQPEKYAAALREWQLSSRIKLTLARMTLSKDPTMEAELRTMVRERAELRLQPLRAEQVRIKARLEKVTMLLDEYDRDPAAAVEKEVTALLTGNIKPAMRPKTTRKAISKDSDSPSESPAATN